MKNKKITVIISFIIIVIICFGVFFITRKNTTNETQSNNEIQQQTIKSTEENKIEKDELEVKEIKIQRNGSEIEVITTIINNSDSTINGFFMDIAILNKDGKVLTSVVANYKENIKPHKSINYKNYVTGEEINVDDVVDAKIKLLEKY